MRNVNLLDEDIDRFSRKTSERCLRGYHREQHCIRHVPRLYFLSSFSRSDRRISVSHRHAGPRDRCRYIHENESTAA